MKTLPLNLVPYKRTAEVTNVSVPSGLLYAYQTREEVWGKIVVFEGALTYRILEPVAEEISLAPGHYGVIEPNINHEVIPQSGVRFYVEFYREADTQLSPRA